jgi:hypothetical protein
MFKVLRTQVDVVLPDGAAVLNAGDARIAEMAELCDGEVIFYSTDPKARPSPRTAPRAAARCLCCKTGRCWPPAPAETFLRPTSQAVGLARAGGLTADATPCWPPWPPPGRWAYRRT